VFSQNTEGRDFAVGDIHGMFNSLENLLHAIDFDTSVDRLFSVGDLIDRGSESYRALDFIREPWFHCVQGNHERLMLDAIHYPDNMDNWLHINGGGWWLNINDSMKQDFADAFQEIPLAIEVQMPTTKIGIIHADIAQGVSWDEFVASFDTDPKAASFAVWSRNRIRMTELTGQASYVEGVDLMIVGHTPLKTAVQVGNVYYLDTAAAYSSSYEDAKLSILEFSPGLELTEFPTSALETLRM
jgi:serine/threonine protein phosphatase 1